MKREDRLEYSSVGFEEALHLSLPDLVFEHDERYDDENWVPWGRQITQS